MILTILICAIVTIALNIIFMYITASYLKKLFGKFFEKKIQISCDYREKNIQNCKTKLLRVD